MQALQTGHFQPRCRPGGARVRVHRVDPSNPPAPLRQHAPAGSTGALAGAGGGAARRCSTHTHTHTHTPTAVPARGALPRCSCSASQLSTPALKNVCQSQSILDSGRDTDATEVVPQGAHPRLVDGKDARQGVEHRAHPPRRLPLCIVVAARQCDEYIMIRTDSVTDIPLCFYSFHLRFLS
jgi:hypothetical protein